MVCYLYVCFALRCWKNTYYIVVYVFIFIFYEITSVVTGLVYQIYAMSELKS